MIYKSIKGKIIEGNKIGRKLGFPTANISIDTPLDIEYGVWIVKVNIDDFSGYGVANIGMKPTIDQNNIPLIEVHIFDFNETVYGHLIEISPIKLLRKQITFGSIEELKKAIETDCENTMEYINSL